MNLIFNIILPYVGLTICNIKTYKQIKDYEQRLLNGFLSITYYRTSRMISNQTRTSYISEENDVEMELNEKMDYALNNLIHFFRRIVKTKWFVMSVVFTTLLYNIPRFFELQTYLVPSEESKNRTEVTLIPKAGTTDLRMNEVLK